MSECRTLFCDIDFGELRMRALYDAKCSVWMSEHLRDHVEKETDCSFKRSFTSESGTRCQFNSTTRRGLISHMVKAHVFYDPVQRAVIANECPWCRSIFSTRLDAQHHACSSFLHIFCRAGGSHVQTEIKKSLLPVVCPLCEIEEVANQESESSSLPRAESVSLQFSSVSDYYDHIIRCHLSLLGIPRARFAKVAQFCCANNAPTARPFAVGNVRRVEKHVPRRGSEGRKTKGWNLCSPKSVIESHKRADAWERIWRSDDGDGLSKYRKWSDWLGENTEESISRLTDTSS